MENPELSEIQEIEQVVENFDDLPPLEEIPDETELQCSSELCVPTDNSISESNVSSEPPKEEWIIVSEEPICAITRDPLDKNMMFTLHNDDSNKVTTLTPLEAPVLNKLQFVPAQKPGKNAPISSSPVLEDENKEPEFLSERLFEGPVVHEKIEPITSEVTPGNKLRQDIGPIDPEPIDQLQELPVLSTKDLIRAYHKERVLQKRTPNPDVSIAQLPQQVVNPSYDFQPTAHESPKKPVSMSYKIDQKTLNKLSQKETPHKELKDFCPFLAGNSTGTCGKTCPVSETDRKLLKFTLDNFGYEEFARLEERLGLSSERTEHESTVENRFHFNSSRSGNNSRSAKKIVNNFYF